ncbi:Uncharacterized protein TCM_022548 [Theobroma cacao]|uniref:Uncharacterized protein n=1 Tax=Theobroma cacao TaxID=3641 RepID=A0A061EV08_THECC|nr:Uncharacterized protein TCM_022548 [Theobroma cacao]
MHDCCVRRESHVPFPHHKLLSLFLPFVFFFWGGGGVGVVGGSSFLSVSLPITFLLLYINIPFVHFVPHLALSFLLLLLVVRNQSFSFLGQSYLTNLLEKGHYREFEKVLFHSHGKAELKPVPAELLHNERE